MGLYINETVQNQSRKTFVIRLPKEDAADFGRLFVIILEVLRSVIHIT